jgi:hypothetical protein
MFPCTLLGGLISDNCTPDVPCFTRVKKRGGRFGVRYLKKYGFFEIYS